MVKVLKHIIRDKVRPCVWRDTFWLYVGTRVWIWIWNWYGDVDLCVQQGGDEWWQKSQLVSGEQLALFVWNSEAGHTKSLYLAVVHFCLVNAFADLFFCCCCCHWRPSILMSRDTWKTSKTTSTLFWKRCMKTTLKSDLKNGEPEVIGILIYDMIWYFGMEGNEWERWNCVLLLTLCMPFWCVEGTPKFDTLFQGKSLDNVRQMLNFEILVATTGLQTPSKCRKHFGSSMLSLT